MPAKMCNATREVVDVVLWTGKYVVDFILSRINIAQAQVSLCRSTGHLSLYFCVLPRFYT